MARVRRGCPGPFCAIVALALLVSATPARPQLRNFHTVQAGVLYRSGQLTPAGLARVLDEYRLRSVVTLRSAPDPLRPHPDDWEVGACAARGVRHVRIEPRAWARTGSGEVPADRTVAEFLAIIDDPMNRPVLVHCEAGSRRTGAVCAAFRIERQGWPAERAIAEMARLGFGPGPVRQGVETHLLARLSRCTGPLPPSSD